MAVTVMLEANSEPGRGDARAPTDSPEVWATAPNIEPTGVTSDLVRFHRPYTHHAFYAFCSKARASVSAAALAKGHEVPR